MLISYLTAEEYSSLGGEIPSAEAELYINKASRHIDSLTFNRILGKGFENLSVFQHELIKEAVQRQADFIYENADVLNSPLSSYSISGVSMSFDNTRVIKIGSVTTTNEIYSLLLSTGLCYRGIG